MAVAAARNHPHRAEFGGRLPGNFGARPPIQISQRFEISEEKPGESARGVPGGGRKVFPKKTRRRMG
jgi:hypothetical protein